MPSSEENDTVVCIQTLNLNFSEYEQQQRLPTVRGIFKREKSRDQNSIGFLFNKRIAKLSNIIVLCQHNFEKPLRPKIKVLKEPQKYTCPKRKVFEREGPLEKI